MKLLKQWTIVAIVLTLSVSAFTGCGKKDLNISENGASILATTEVAETAVATVNDEAITVADLQYYIYSSAMMQLYQKNPKFDGDISNIKWTEKQESGKTLEETILDDALNMAITDLITSQKGAEQGIVFSEEEKNQMNQFIDNFVSQYGDEIFRLNLNAMGMSSKEDYQRIYERITLSQMIEEDIQANTNKYISDIEELKKYKGTDKATVQHVLILSEGSKFENPETVAKEVLVKARADEDFVALMEQYNEDPGATAAGYTFGPGEMVEEFEKASFALEIEEISDIVQTDYGYHIIKRMVGAAELQNYWKAEADIDRKNNVLRKVSVPDIMNAIVNTQKKLQQMNMSEEADTAEGEVNNG